MGLGGLLCGAGGVYGLVSNLLFKLGSRSLRLHTMTGHRSRAYVAGTNVAETRHRISSPACLVGKQMKAFPTDD